jgi:hypothetical protein
MDETEDFRDRMGALAALLVVACAVIFGLYSWAHPLPPVGRNYADGVYRNAECGWIKLQGGVATFDGGSVAYTLERGKGDVKALPPQFLGVRTSNAGCKVTYDRSRFPLYLSLGSDVPPKIITLSDVERNLAYDFARAKGDQRSPAKQ